VVEKSQKILIFSTSYYPFVGGAEVAIKEITDRIPDGQTERRFQFDLITAKFDKKLPKFERIGNINVYRLGFGISILDKLLLPFWGARKTASLNKKNNYSAYWCIMATFASGAAYIANIFSKNKVPIILTLQEGDSEEHFKKRWFGLINLSWVLALRNTSILTVISSYLADRAKRFGYEKEIKIIPNGVDIAEFSKEISNEEKNGKRKELGLKENDIALITTSRLVAKNGVGDVIKALSKLPENIKFVILGEGELKERLEDLAKKLKVSERVIFKGHVSHNELPKLLKTCDIFIRPSLSEGMGNSFIEAMAAGIPVIATPVGGIIDFISDPAESERSRMKTQTGYFCQPQNPESIAETIKRVINDPNKNKIIEEAFKTVKEKYDWNLIAQQMNEVFDSLNANGK
jgi:glycosyltransferase involved in cell wall biosynthesis